MDWLLFYWYKFLFLFFWFKFITISSKQCVCVQQWTMNTCYKQICQIYLEKRSHHCRSNKSTRIITIIIMPPKTKIEAHKHILFIEFLHENTYKNTISTTFGQFRPKGQSNFFQFEYICCRHISNANANHQQMSSSTVTSDHSIWKKMLGISFSFLFENDLSMLKWPIFVINFQKMFERYRTICCLANFYHR